MAEDNFELVILLPPIPSANTTTFGLGSAGDGSQLQGMLGSTLSA